MMRDFDDATRAQIEAARPDASTWLTANAGSGKTRVLTDRVARLLLDDVEPMATAANAVGTLRVIEAIRESSDTGKRIDLR